MAVETAEQTVAVVDLATTTLRELNQRLHDARPDDPAPRRWRVENPNGAHAVACGLDAPLEVEITGHVGYYCAGMNKQRPVLVRGNAGTGLAENLMSGIGRRRREREPVRGRDGPRRPARRARRRRRTVRDLDEGRRHRRPRLDRPYERVHGAARRLVVCGDAGDALGDSIYETHLYVRGRVASLGADCVEKELRDRHVAELQSLLERAGFDDVDPSEFRRYGSARRLYNFQLDNAGSY